MDFRALYTKEPFTRDAVVAAGKTLEERGVSAVAGGCGYMAQHQRALAGALGIPVFLSSLLFIPFVRRLYAPHARIGVLCAHSGQLDEAILEPAGVDPRDPALVIQGLEGCPHFHDIIFKLGTVIDTDRLCRELAGAASELAAKPGVKAMVFECTVLPAYGRAIQRAVGMPIYDLATLLKLAHNALLHP